MELYLFLHYSFLLVSFLYSSEKMLNVYYNKILLLRTSKLIIFIPYLFIFLNAIFIPIKASPHKPIFQPPNWVFGFAWTIISLSFGLCTYIYLSRFITNYNNNKRIIIYFYQLVFLINLWPFLNFNNLYEIAFWLLLFTTYYSISFTILLILNSIQTANHKYIFLMFPLIFWLILATALNGVIWDYVDTN